MGQEKRKEKGYAASILFCPFLHGTLKKTCLLPLCGQSRQGGRIMKRLNRVLAVLLCAVMVVGSTGVSASAHSGRTDGSGGHRDNNNVSGLGSYHYHCGGYPAHLHVSGYCPYLDKFPTGVSLKVEKTTLSMGEEVEISAAVSPSNACSTSVTWESSDTSVVTVRSGKIKAVGFGTAIISASTFNDKTATLKITVKEVVAEGVEITGFDTLEHTLYIGDQKTLGAVITPENVDNKELVWSTSDPSVLSVDNGAIEALKPGTATVTVETANGKTASLALTVEEIIAERIEIQMPETVTIGDTAQLSVVFYPADTSYQDIQWSSSDDSVATVDSAGNLTAVGVGKAVITAVQKDVQATVEIEVLPIPVEEIAFTVADGFDGKMEVGETTQILAAVLPGNATYPELTWTSSDPAVAAVDADGIVTALAPGQVTIMAQSADGVSADIALEVADDTLLLVLAGVGAALVLIILICAVLLLRKKKTGDSGTEGAGAKSRKKWFVLLGVVAAAAAVAAGVFGYTSAMDGKYKEAIFLAQGGRALEAARLLEELGGYKDAPDQLAALKEADGIIAIRMAKAGDTVTFGSYEQDGDTSNGSEPIEWMVLRTDSQGVLLLSLNILDTQPYLEIETEDGVQDLDQWMDTTFAETAFAGCSTEAIQDVGLLTKDALEEYSSQAREGGFTEYAMSRGSTQSYLGEYMWWLEGAYKFNGRMVGSVVAEGSGYSNGFFEADRRAGVRPTLTIGAAEE